MNLVNNSMVLTPYQVLGTATKKVPLAMSVKGCNQMPEYQSWQRVNVSYCLELLEMIAPWLRTTWMGIRLATSPKLNSICLARERGVPQPAKVVPVDSVKIWAQMLCNGHQDSLRPLSMVFCHLALIANDSSNFIPCTTCLIFTSYTQPTRHT